MNLVQISRSLSSFLFWEGIKNLLTKGRLSHEIVHQTLYFKESLDVEVYVTRALKLD